jgi:hypothetical protein
VQSNSVTNAVGDDASNKLLKFLRGSVFPHEDHFGAQHYHFTFSFNEYTNTCLEGTNNGLKYNSDAVLPSMCLAQAGKCMINQDESKSSVLKRKASAEFNNVPLYTKTKTSTHINEVAEDMMKREIELADSYSSVRLSEKKWAVRYTAVRKGSEEERSANVWPMPIFDRTRIVSLNADGGLQCTCGYANRNGIPDRHIMHVATSYGINFEGFSHHNVHVRFWRAFNKFVAVGDPSDMDASELQIRQKLRQARFSPTLIISVPGGFRPFEAGMQFSIGKNSEARFLCMDATSAFDHFDKHMDVSVMNYSVDMVDKAVAAMRGTSSVHTVGLSQEMYTTNGDDDFEHDDDVEVIDFDEHNELSFLAWQSTNAVTNKNSHQILYPRLKELASVYENNPAKLREVAAILDELIQKGKAENAAMEPKPSGTMVSAVARNRNVHKKKHSKQRYDR